MPSPAPAPFHQASLALPLTGAVAGTLLWMPVICLLTALDALRSWCGRAIRGHRAAQ